MTDAVAVVGGAGYIGTVLAGMLADAGYPVRVIDGFLFGDFLPKRPEIEVLRMDMRQASAADFEGCRAIVNLGGLSNDPMANFNPEANRELNTEAALHIARVGLSAGVRRYVYASSCSIYDGSLDVVLDESAPVKPQSYYASSKFDAERRLLELSYMSSQFEPVIFRKGTVHGWSPRLRYDLVVNTFVKEAMAGRPLKVHGTGEMWRPLVDVRDVARAYVLAVDASSDAAKGEVFNIVGENFRIGDLAPVVQSELAGLGIATDIVFEEASGPVRNYRATSAKARDVIGWEAKIPLAGSIASLVSNIRSHDQDDFDNPVYYNIDWVKQRGDFVGLSSVQPERS